MKRKERKIECAGEKEIVNRKKRKIEKGEGEKERVNRKERNKECRGRKDRERLSERGGAIKRRALRELQERHTDQTDERQISHS